MLKLHRISKRFSLKQAALVNQTQHKDTRIKGRFFNALNEVSLSCESGEVLGLLGANGAGKTTLLRILSTALKADHGEIEFNQSNIQHSVHQYRKQIGFLAGTTGLYERLTGYENLVYFARLYGLNEREVTENINKISQALNLADFLHRRLSEYSTGMKQRIAIARAVLHQPKLVILDEPTTGLDVVAKEVILSFIEYLVTQGNSVIFSTHDMAEVERLCQRVCIIDQGECRFLGSVDKLKQETGTRYLQQALLNYMSGAQLANTEAMSKPL